MKKDNIWNIILIVSLVLIVHGMANSGSDDKKTAQAAQTETTTGLLGAASFVMKKQFALTAAALVSLTWAGIVLIGGGPFFVQMWKNLFSPPTISPIIWVVAAVVIIIMLKGNRGGK